MARIKDKGKPEERENSIKWMEKLLSTNPNLVLLADGKGKLLYTNRAGVMLLRKWNLRVGDELPPAIRNIVERALSQGAPEDFEVRVGSRVYLLSFHPSPEEGHVSLCGFDVTAQKETEEKLRNNENKFRLVVEQTGQLFYEYDVAKDEIKWAGAVKEITGYGPEEIRKMNLAFWFEHVHPEDLEKVQERRKECIRAGEKFRMDYRFRKKDGGYIYVEDQSLYQKDEKGFVCRILGIIKDITERKLAREKLEKSEERFRIIVEQTGQGIYDYDVFADHLRWEGAMEKITGYRCRDPCLSSKKLWTSHIHPEDRARAIEYFEKALEEGGRYHQEYRVERKDGIYAHVEVSGAFLRDDKGRVYRLLGTINDVTEKKHSEDAIRKAEDIRKKEIHHRIKNNLQVISSLLDLQAGFFEDEKVREAFRESQNRVITMALIHEELYRGEEVETLDFAAYLRKLVPDLFESYKVGSSKIHLNVEAEEQVFLCMDTAIPLGIIVNELVSNSLKHAFPEGGGGTIRIRFYSTEKTLEGSEVSRENEKNGERDEREEREEYGRKGSKPEGKTEKYGKCCENLWCLLVVSDNGMGFPQGLNLKNPETLGLQLVKTLVEQIDGEIELRTNGGTEFRIGFGKKRT